MWSQTLVYLFVLCVKWVMSNWIVSLGGFLLCRGKKDRERKKTGCREKERERRREGQRERTDECLSCNPLLCLLPSLLDFWSATKWVWLSKLFFPLKPLTKRKHFEPRRTKLKLSLACADQENQSKIKENGPRCWLRCGDGAWALQRAGLLQRGSKVLFVFHLHIGNVRLYTWVCV